MGVTFPDGVIWPEERTSWTAAAVLLAHDALHDLTPASRLFSHEFWRRKRDLSREERERLPNACRILGKNPRPGHLEVDSLRRDHRPYILKRLDLNFQKWYANHFLRPQFEHLGQGCTFMKPWHVEIFGGPVSLGDYATVIATPDRKVRLTVWSDLEGGGKDRDRTTAALICPGVRISAATEIVDRGELHAGPGGLCDRFGLARRLRPEPADRQYRSRSISGTMSGSGTAPSSARGFGSEKTASSAPVPSWSGISPPMP